MNVIPAEVGESLISHNVTVRGSSRDIGVLDPATGEFRSLTLHQLEEVAAVYNAWRVGNLQDCTIRTPGDIKF